MTEVHNPLPAGVERRKMPPPVAATSCPFGKTIISLVSAGGADPLFVPSFVIVVHWLDEVDVLPPPVGFARRFPRQYDPLNVEVPLDDEAKNAGSARSVPR